MDTFVKHALFLLVSSYFCGLDTCTNMYGCGRSGHCIFYWRYCCGSSYVFYCCSWISCCVFLFRCTWLNWNKCCVAWCCHSRCCVICCCCICFERCILGTDCCGGKKDCIFWFCCGCDCCIFNCRWQMSCVTSCDRCDRYRMLFCLLDRSCSIWYCCCWSILKCVINCIYYGEFTLPAIFSTKVILRKCPNHGSFQSFANNKCLHFVGNALGIIITHPLVSVIRIWCLDRCRFIIYCSSPLFRTYLIVRQNPGTPCVITCIPWSFA